MLSGRQESVFIKLFFLKFSKNHTLFTIISVVLRHKQWPMIMQRDFQWGYNNARSPSSLIILLWYLPQISCHRQHVELYFIANVLQLLTLPVFLKLLTETMISGSNSKCLHINVTQ